MLTMMRMIDWMRAEFWWLVHSCIAHPICGLLSFIAAVIEVAGSVVAAWYVDGWSQWLHDVTLPNASKSRGRS